LLKLIALSSNMSIFLHKIYHWYEKHKRPLPWRETTDPYKIWLSEIILQQTRIEQGKSYYLNFIKKFPTIHYLAEAEEDDVLKLWQGLGYYSRARNLHVTAKHVSQKLKGKFPKNFNELLQLKGIGPYTAAAVGSIAFELPYPTVDGNVYRVLSRYFGIETPIDSSKGKKDFYDLALKLTPKKNVGFHNQSIMEFGALQCIPKSPDCENCPLNDSCWALANRMVAKLPIKEKKTRQRNRFFYYLFIDAGSFTFLEKRTENDIWQNLYQFPLKESVIDLNDSEIINLPSGVIPNSCNPTIKTISSPKKHILSHQVIYARLIYVEIKNSDCLKDQFIKVNKKDISKFAVSRLVDKFIQELKIN